MKRTQWESIRVNVPPGWKQKAKLVAGKKGHLVFAREVLVAAVDRRLKKS